MGWVFLCGENLWPDRCFSAIYQSLHASTESLHLIRAKPLPFRFFPVLCTLNIVQFVLKWSQILKPLVRKLQKDSIDTDVNDSDTFRGLVSTCFWMLGQYLKTAYSRDSIQSKNRSIWRSKIWAVLILQTQTRSTCSSRATYCPQSSLCYPRRHLKWKTSFNTFRIKPENELRRSSKIPCQTLKGKYSVRLRWKWPHFTVRVLTLILLWN